MPSKTIFTLTGMGVLVARCASMTCADQTGHVERGQTASQPSSGPLSSVEPRPYMRPVFSSITSLNGSVFQPSDSCAG